MASVSTDSKNSLRYTSTLSNESASRTIGGLNVSAGSGSPNSGPNRNTAITHFIETLNSFTQGTNSNWRWISELVVNV